MTRNLGKIFREYSYRTEICVLKETADSRARRIFEILDVNDDGRKTLQKDCLDPSKHFFTQIVDFIFSFYSTHHLFLQGELEMEEFVAGCLRYIRNDYNVLDYDTYDALIQETSH